MADVQTLDVIFVHGQRHDAMGGADLHHLDPQEPGGGVAPAHHLGGPFGQLLRGQLLAHSGIVACMEGRALKTSNHLARPG